MVDKVKGQGLRLGDIGGKVHVGQASHAHRQLVHEAAGLAKPVLLHALGHLRGLHRINGTPGPECLQRTTEGELVGGRGREAAPGGDVACHDEVEARRGPARTHQLCRHSPHERRRGHALLRARVKFVKRNLDRLVTLAEHPRHQAVVCHGKALNATIECPGYAASALVIGMVASNLAPCGGTHGKDRVARQQGMFRQHGTEPVKDTSCINH